MAGGAEWVDACLAARSAIPANKGLRGWADAIDRAWLRVEMQAKQRAVFTFREMEYATRHWLAQAAMTAARRVQEVQGKADEMWNGRLALGMPRADTLTVPRSAAFASIVINLFGLALPLTILEVYDSVIPHGAGGQLFVLAFGFVVVLAIESLLRVSRAYVTGLSAAKFEAAAISEGLRRFVSAPRELTSQDPPTRHLLRLNAASRLADFYGGQMRWAMIDLPFVALYVGVMAVIGGPIVLVPIAILAAFFILSATQSEKLTAAIRDREDQDTKVYDFISECLNGIVNLKGAAMEPFMARRLERLLGQSRAINEKTILTSGQQENLANLLGNVTFIAMAAVGGILAVFGSMSMGTLAACSLLAGRIIQPVLRAASVWRAVHGLRLAQTEAQALFDLPPPPALNAQTTAPPIVELLLRNQGGDVLARCGSSGLIAIAGNDGAARSELLLALVTGATNAGALLEINGKGASEYRAMYKRAIMYTSPKLEALSGTILENLTLFGRGPAVSDVIWACELIGLRRDIDRLAGGFETRIGEGSSNTLPSGLMHRIAIARALAVRAKIIVLDEPQALLDQPADRSLLAGLARLKSECVVIIGSSRPSYLKGADHVLILENQRLRALSRDGTPIAMQEKGVA